MINPHSTRYPTSLFIFRRDLRLQDNTGLNHALHLSTQVIPCFIFDPQQITPHPYQSQPALRFMLQSLQDLQQQFHQLDGELALYHAAPDTVIAQLSVHHKITAVFINRDYTPFSRQRDDNIAAICQRLGLALYVVPDVLLNEPEPCLKSDNTPYKVFTAFYNNAKQLPIAPPQALAKGLFLKVSTEITLAQFNLPFSATATIQGGRQPALAILANLAHCHDYAQSRDFPSQDTTSYLSAHLKFGTCSIREAYYSVLECLGSEHPLIRQFYWRDFFTHLAYHFPRVFGQAFLSHFAAMVWDNNQAAFQRWTSGTTGFPIVDAGMRQLNSTGFMHNRVRMIVASFLVKDLHIDWRWGERYFAQHLVDYDPCVNNGNWQWAASTGCDAQPYFRIFNPWLQQQKFDPAGAYLYRWLPEIKGIAIKALHQWYKKQVECDYPAPMVNHDEESRLAKQRFKQAMLSFSAGSQTT
jgi:deoxyribodipyrimidine photo-lyase